MDQKKIGQLVRQLRKERNLTQRQIANGLGVDHRTVSKWERGLGCPDISLLNTLAVHLGVPVDRLLQGDLAPNEKNGGNMKRVKFFLCPTCGNLLTAAGKAELSCCGRTLSPLQAHHADDTHCCSVEEMDDDWYVTFSHPMEKGHYITFAAYVSYDRVLMVKLYPEQGGELRLPRMYGGKLYLCCNQHGLFEMKR